FNVLRGDMSIVGPRPEDPDIVERHYTPLLRETLAVRPGLASPGSLYHYTHGDALLAGGDPETAYVERLLPLKVALDVVYVRRRPEGDRRSTSAPTCGPSPARPFRSVPESRSPHRRTRPTTTGPSPGATAPPTTGLSGPTAW